MTNDKQIEKLVMLGISDIKININGLNLQIDELLV